MTLRDLWSRNPIWLFLDRVQWLRMRLFASQRDINRQLLRVGWRLKRVFINGI
jgi:hypothetical protein